MEGNSTNRVVNTIHLNYTTINLLIFVEDI